MQKLLACTPALVGGTIVAFYLLPHERRKRLSRLPGSLMGKMMEHMPDE